MIYDRTLNLSVVILEVTLVVSYPTTEEIKSIIKDAGF